MNVDRMESAEKVSMGTGDRGWRTDMEKFDKWMLIYKRLVIVVWDVTTAAGAAPQYQAYSKAYRLDHSGGCRLGYSMTLSTGKPLN